MLIRKIGISSQDIYKLKTPIEVPDTLTRTGMLLYIICELLGLEKEQEDDSSKESKDE